MERFRDGTQFHSAAVRGPRVPPRPLWSKKGTHGLASAMHHPLSHRGTGPNRAERDGGHGQVHHGGTRSKSEGRPEQRG